MASTYDKEPTPYFDLISPPDDNLMVMRQIILNQMVSDPYYIFHPQQMQQISDRNQDLYFKILSRSLRLWKPTDFHSHTTPLISRPSVNGPKASTCPPAVDQEKFQSSDIRSKLLYYRQTAAEKLFAQLEENGWLGWERKLVDMDAIERDFGPNSMESMSDEEIEKLLGRQKAIHTSGPIHENTVTSPFREENNLPSDVQTIQQKLLDSSNASRVVRYTDEDEIEELESDHEGETPAEYRARAVKEIKRDQNKRVALLMADLMLEGKRSQLMDA